MYIIFHFSDSNSVHIAKPVTLAGMTLEERLTTYDWTGDGFIAFQNATLEGTHKPLCYNGWNKKIYVRNTSILSI